MRVTEIIEAKTTPLNDVKDKIRKDIALLRANNSLIDVQEAVEDARAGGASLADIGNRMNITARTIDSVDRSGRKPDGTLITDLPGSSKLLQQAFQSQVGTQEAPLEMGSNGYLWFDITAITKARDQTQEEVAAKVKADWIAAEQAKLISAKADEIKDRLNTGTAFVEIAAELGIEVKTTGFLNRTGQEDGFTVEATKAGYGGDEKSVSIVDGARSGEKILITVAERKGPEAQIVKAPEAQIKLANEGAADDLLSQMIANLQNKYVVTTNPAVINQALTQGY